ncbi:MAG TPA: AsmA family protein [Acidobacteriota bacterium]|nr:AsmA family protein [Acidobacteriota bacterium]
MGGESKRRFSALKITAIIVLLLVALIVAVPFLVDANQFRPKVESELTSALGREVKVGNLKLSLFSGGVAADEISIGDDPSFSRSPFVRARSLSVGVELKPLIFSREVRITGITLDQPEITLIHSAAGNWNFSTISSASTPAPVEKAAPKVGGQSDTKITVGQLKVTNGRVTVIRAGPRPKPRVYEKVNVQARDISFDSVFPRTVTANLPGGGSLKLEGKIGPMNRTDASLTPVAAALAVSHFDIIASGFVEPDSGLAGVLDFDGSLTSDGRQIRSKGTGKADKLQIVRGGSRAGLPVSLGYMLDYNMKNQSGTLSETKVEFGKSVARLNGSFDAGGDSTLVKMRLRGNDMPAGDLEALLPALAITLPKGASLQGGTLNADLSAEGPVDKLITSGTMGLFNARLAGFDLGAKMATVASLAGIKSNPVTAIEKFASDLRVAPDGIQASNLQLIVPGLGQLLGGGTVGSNSSLDFKMQARLTTPGGVIGSLTRSMGNEVNVPFFIRGTTSNPTFVPDVKGAAGSLLDSVVSGKDKSGEGTKSLGDTLRGLLGKKKK